jgi:Ubiquitin-2 like Rad60 SUMO-like
MPPKVNLELDGNFEDEILKPPKPIMPPVQEVPEEEEEFPEYVAKAREGARRRVFERLDPGKSNARSDSISSDGSTVKPETNNTVLSGKASPPAPDPIVHILVSSRIEGTKPMILKRKLSQRLKDVRIAWCDKQIVDGQPVSEEAKRQIFLTWRGNRVFDLTTCKSMGVKVDSRGKLRSDGEGVNGEGQVHLEAWTEEIFAEYNRQKAAERKRRAPDPMEEEEEEGLQPEEQNGRDEVQRLKVILKSKNNKESRLIISPDHLVSKLISAFRNQNKIADEVEISLYLDGDKLDPASTVGDADIEEMTTIDVHVG